MNNTHTWHNNQISKKLNLEYERDFSICDIDGCVRCYYKDSNNNNKIRLIIYESKFEHEKISKTQILTLNLLNKSIDWNKFDSYSGIYIIKIKDLDNELIWENLNGRLIRKTNFKELYYIFSCKELF